MVDLAQTLVSATIGGRARPLFEGWWIATCICGGERVPERPTEGPAPIAPSWRRHVWRLLAIADGAAKGTALHFYAGQTAEFANGEAAPLHRFEGEVI